MESLTIDGRFNGPEGSANGGYTCGLIAGLFGQTAEVTLRRPPPLDRPLGVDREGERLLVRDGDALVAEAAPAKVELDVPGAPSYEESEERIGPLPGLRGARFPYLLRLRPRARAGRRAADLRWAAGRRPGG